MFRNLLICAVASASALGCAGMTNPRSDNHPVASAVQPCPLSNTASRIPTEPGRCSSSPGRDYSQTEIQQTGQTNAADALRMLDPTITVHH